MGRGCHQRQGVGREAFLGESHPHSAGNDDGICDDDGDDIMPSTWPGMLMIKSNAVCMVSTARLADGTALMIFCSKKSGFLAGNQLHLNP